MLVLWAANPLTGRALGLCLENAARVDNDTLKVFRAELGRVFSESNRQADFEDCGPDAIRIDFQIESPADEPSALGGIRQRDGVLFPEIALFVSPTAEIIGSRLPALLGRALARVATHELGHWLSQSSAHASRGVMMERLSAAHLLAVDSSGIFRVPPGD